MRGGVKACLFALLLGFFTPLLAETLWLESRYFYKESPLTSRHFFPDLPEFVVLEIPVGHALHKSRSSDIIRAFAAQGISVKAKTSIIEFIRDSATEFRELEERVGALFVQEYAKNQILVQRVRIEPTVATNLQGWKLLEISFDPKLLRRRHGTFSAHYVNEAGEMRRFFFRYEVEASLEAIFTKETLKGGDVLDLGSVEVRRIPLERVSSELMRRTEVGRVSIKAYTKAGTLLTQERLIPKVIVRRGDRIRVSVKESGVRVEFSAMAQQEGALGDKIRAQSEGSKKMLEVRIVGENEAVME